jgi:hypothetical protein
MTVPALIPLSNPEVPIVALELLLDQLPVPRSVSVVDDPVHTEEPPEMEDGKGFTVNSAETPQPVERI